MSQKLRELAFLRDVLTKDYVKIIAIWIMLMTLFAVAASVQNIISVIKISSDLNTLSFVGAIKLVALSVFNIVNTTDIAILIGMIVVALLGGVYLSMVTRRKIIYSGGGKSLLSGILLALGVGCGACGFGILYSVAIALGATALLPFIKNIGILAIVASCGLLSYSIWSLSKQMSIGSCDI